jgi:hypothetical protein
LPSPTRLVGRWLPTTLRCLVRRSWKACGPGAAVKFRPTARAKPAAKRERRRPDPLLAVTAELEEWYQAEPSRTSREFLERMQAKYPGPHRAAPN